MPRARRSSLNASVALGLVIAVSAGAARADQNAEARAKIEFSAAEKAFDQNDNVAALEHFRKAFELAPRSAVHFNIGVCLERLGRFKEATEEYEAAAKSADLDAEKRERAASEATRVRSRLGKLSVDATPAGGELFVDGARACALPCEILLDPRTHALVMRNGSVEKSKNVTLASGETTRLQVELEAAAKPSREASSSPSPKPDRTDRESSLRPGVLTWVGGGVAVVGTAAFIGFYLRTKKLESDYADDRNTDTRDEGRRMGTFTNVSLGVAIVGVGLVAVDLFLLPKRDASAKNRPIGAITF